MSVSLPAETVWHRVEAGGVSEMSNSLEINVARQINEQLDDGAYQNPSPASDNTMQEGKVMHFSQ